MAGGKKEIRSRLIKAADINSKFAKFKTGKSKLEDYIRLAEDIAGGKLMEVIGRVPVYLVNEDTMDCVCPPEKYLSTECLSQVLSDFDPVELLGEKKNGYREPEEFLRDVDRKLDDITRRVEECRKEKMTSFHALGCYVDSHAALNCFDDEHTREKLRESKKAIFICPERIHEHSEKLGVPFEVYFISVLLHEFAHAYLDDGSPQSSELWENVWSEGLANSLAYALVYLSESMSKSKKSDFPAYMTKIVSHEPLEYRTSLLLLSDPSILIATQKIWISLIYQGDIPISIEKFLRDPHKLKDLSFLIYSLTHRLADIFDFPYRFYRVLSSYPGPWILRTWGRYIEEKSLIYFFFFFPLPSLFVFYPYIYFILGKAKSSKGKGFMTSFSFLPFSVFLGVWRERKENIYGRDIISKYRKLLFKLLALHMLKKVLKT